MNSDSKVFFTSFLRHFNKFGDNSLFSDIQIILQYRIITFNYFGQKILSSNRGTMEIFFMFHFFFL